MPASLRLPEARRVALSAQGFCDPEPSGRVDIRHLRRVLDRVQLFQIDSVNVLVRSHYLPLFSRLGSYPEGLLESAAYERSELFEYWAHEASLLPVSAHPEHRWTMEAFRQGVIGKRMHAFAAENRELLEAVERQVTERGGVAAGDLDAPGEGSGPWWGWAPGKTALEWLFAIGRLAVRERRGFARVYDLTERVIPKEVLEQPALPPEDAVRRLTMRAVRALGVGTVSDIADYFRLKGARVRPALKDLVASGEVVEMDVEGWRGPSYAPADLQVPRRVDAHAVLSPFDSLVWKRDRTERLFDFHYRIEIYTPKEKRRYGYYVLPFLLGESLAGRIDLKADRKGRRLLVLGAYPEDGADRREVAPHLATELDRVRAWLGLEEIAVSRRGGLAEPLRRSVQLL
jgi:uncharacterized protein